MEQKPISLGYKEYIELKRKADFWDLMLAHKTISFKRRKLKYGGFKVEIKDYNEVVKTLGTAALTLIKTDLERGIL